MAGPRSSPSSRTPASGERAQGTPDSDTAQIPSTKRTSSLSSPVEQALEILLRYVSAPTARSIMSLAEQRRGPAGGAELAPLLDSIEHSLRLFVPEPERVRECCSLLRALAETGPAVSAAAVVAILAEDDIVKARLEGRRAATAAGFSAVGVTRLMTAISEVARNIVLYAGQGQIEIQAVARGIEIVARDRGPGIANLDQVMSGQYKSRLGMGLGLRGVKKLAEQFEVQTAPGRGTTVRFVVRVA